MHRSLERACLHVSTDKNKIRKHVTGFQVTLGEKGEKKKTIRIIDERSTGVVRGEFAHPMEKVA